MRGRHALLACALLLAAACAPRGVMREGVPVPYEKAARDDLDQARRLASAGELEQASRLLQRLAQELPGTRPAPEALFLLGKIELERGRPEAAVMAWRSLRERYPRSPRVPESSLRLAEVYRRRGRPEIARRVLEEAPIERADRELRVRMFRLLADLSRSLGDVPSTVRALAYTRRDTSDPEALYELDLELSDLVQERLQESQLAALVDRLPGGPVHDRVLLEVARRQLSRRDFDGALRALDRLPRRLRPPEEAERTRLRALARSGAVAEIHALGLAVPLSGSYAPFGESVLRGVTMGLGIFDHPPASYRLLIRDTAGDAERGGSAVRELAELGVRAIIGPMRSVVAEAAAPVAEGARVPLLTLAPREEVSRLGRFVFRAGLAPADQVAELVDWAIDRMGYRRFAILYPRVDYGLRFKNLFWDRVEKGGGVIVGVEGYPPDAVDLQAEIKKLIGLYYLTPEERKLIDERERLGRHRAESQERLAEIEEMDLPPYIDFDALFIPDVAEKVGLILPQLRLYDIREVRLLGTSDWNNPKLIEIAGRDASGVIFTGAFHARSRDPVVAGFVSAFLARFGHPPDLFASQGFDVASILRNRMDASAGLSREQLRVELLRVTGHAGVSGMTAFDEDGGARRRLRLLTVYRGVIREFDAFR